MSSITTPDISASFHGLPERITGVVQQAIEQQRIAGTVILIAHHGKLIYQLAAGYRDKEQNIVMTQDTIFRLASVSKPIVSTAALILVEQGKLQLDEPIHHLLPYFRPQLKSGTQPDITLRQLLSHSAGLGYRFFEQDEQGDYSQANVSDGMDNQSINIQANLERINRAPLIYPPGTAWGYSLAIDVVGRLIEVVTGLTLSDAVKQLVSQPLNMPDTDFYVKDQQRLAAVYVNNADGYGYHRMYKPEQVPAFPDTQGILFDPDQALNQQAYQSGGAGMLGTASDFLKLLEALRTGQPSLLSSALKASMTKDHSPGLDLPASPGFGFGLAFSVLRDATLANTPESVGTWRWGGAYGHSWFVDPQQALAVVAFSNTLYEGMSGPFVTQIRDAVYGWEHNHE